MLTSPLSTELHQNSSADESSLVQLVQMINSPSVLVDHKGHIIASCESFDNWPLFGISADNCAPSRLRVNNKKILDDLGAVFLGNTPDARLVGLRGSDTSESVFEISYHGLRHGMHHDMRHGMHHDMHLSCQEISYCLIHVADVTQREKATQILLSANDELTQLQYHLSHDLVAPIASANGLLGLIKDDVVAGEYGELSELTEETMLQLQRLKNLVNDLMSLARAGAAIAENTSFDLRELIDEIVQSISLHDRVLEVSVSLDFDKAIFFSDRIRIKQILMNLISNSRKFADSSEEAPEIIVKAENFCDYMRICVSDNGLGIDNKMLPGLFDMFTRGVSDCAGHGLGLYIVQKHVQHLNGSVRLLNQAKPTVFELIIPLASIEPGEQ